MKIDTHHRLQVVKHRPTKLLKFSLVVIGLLLSAQIFVSNQLASYGERLAKTEQEITRLREINLQLRNQVASASAMLTLKQKAFELGFVENATPVYFSPEFPVALEAHP